MHSLYLWIGTVLLIFSLSFLFSTVVLFLLRQFWFHSFIPLSFDHMCREFIKITDFRIIRKWYLIDEFPVSFLYNFCFQMIILPYIITVLLHKIKLFYSTKKVTWWLATGDFLGRMNIIILISRCVLQYLWGSLRIIYFQILKTEKFRSWFQHHVVHWLGIINDSLMAVSVKRFSKIILSTPLHLSYFSISRNIS